MIKVNVWWPNLKNLSGGLNLTRGLNMGRAPLKIVSNVSRFKPALNLNRVLADLNRGSNSLNSIAIIRSCFLVILFFGRLELKNSRERNSASEHFLKRLLLYLKME